MNNRKKLIVKVCLCLFVLLIFAMLFIFILNKMNDEHVKQNIEEIGGSKIVYEIIGENNPSQSDIEDTILKLTKRAESYCENIEVYQDGNNHLVVEIWNEIVDESTAQMIGSHAKLYFIEETNSEGESNYHAAFDVDDDGNMTNYGYRLDKSIEEIEAAGSILLTGTDVESANARTMADEFGKSQNVVELSMTAEGTKKFAEATKKAYEKGETLAIYYEGELISVPYVNTPIEDGKAIITGIESYVEADTLASYLRIGELKLNLKNVDIQIFK